MYKIITEEDLEEVRKVGHLKIVQSPNFIEPACNGNGYVELINNENKENKYGLFKFKYSYTRFGLVFSDLDPVHTIPSQREYEKFLILTLLKLLWLAAEFSVPKLLIQSGDPRVLEGYYETGFDKIQIIGLTNTKKIYVATKHKKKEEEKYEDN